MKMTTLTLASVLAVASVSAVAADDKAAAEVKPAVQPEVMTEEQPKSESIFEKLDADKDGKVSQQEAQVSPALVKGFEKIDTNKDGFLSQDEFSMLQVKNTSAKTYAVVAAV
ncbi:EF-hand domain-containing protein [uncultured Neptuniibacter sp.]|uniref:EF-hand domain-containing protein n=1 Tax=uncultured Neptuniibacter sp. TaxID=502143 RepID=UPI00260F5DE5|nr:EF-hand domain-containing protein [uncultured Neptuniibacter sp.]